MRLRVLRSRSFDYKTLSPWESINHSNRQCGRVLAVCLLINHSFGLTARSRPFLTAGSRVIARQIPKTWPLHPKFSGSWVLTLQTLPNGGSLCLWAFPCWIKTEDSWPPLVFSSVSSNKIKNQRSRNLDFLLSCSTDLRSWGWRYKTRQGTNYPKRRHVCWVLLTFSPQHWLRIYPVKISVFHGFLCFIL